MSPPTVRVQVRGDLDLFSASHVSRRIERARQQGCHTVLVDAAGVTFVNGSALGVFIRTLRTLTEDAGSLQFTAVSPSFERLCALTGIDTVLGLGSLTVPETPVDRGR